MRTKSLILMAVVGVAATVSALAQNNVYSVNAVGYVNKTLAPGYTLIANPLNAGSNSISQVMPSVPLGSRIFRYAANSFVPITFEEDDNGVQGWNNNVTLNPGEGFFFQNPRSTNITITFVGEVPQGTALNNPIPAGFSLKSSIVPQSAILDMSANGLNFPVALGDRIYRWTGTGYAIANYEEDDNGVQGWNNPALATPGVGDGFFIFSGTAKTWTRNFSATN